MALYHCPKCNTFVDKRQIPAHVKKCGNRGFSIYKRRS